MNEQLVASSGVKVTDQMINSMPSIKSWTKFLSIMGFIGTGFMVLLGIFVIFAGNLIPKAANIPAVMGIFYIVAAIFYLIPSVYLFKYSSAIGRFLGTKSEFEMESALSYQKSFWKFLGILCLIGIIIAIIGIIAAIVIPIVVKSGFKA
ncbi:MAG: DUF5362 family protein [Smithellaceae bacterium]|jgi:hypothetical protein